MPDLALGSIATNTIAGVRAVIALMQVMVKDAANNQSLKNIASHFRSIGDVVHYVRSIKYVPDPAGTEYVRHPVTTLGHRQGDCEDLSVLFAALCVSTGMKCRFAVISTDTAGVYTHVYCEVLLGENGWQAVELIRDWPVGQAAPHKQKVTFSVLPDANTERELRSSFPKARFNGLSPFEGRMVPPGEVAISQGSSPNSLSPSLTSSGTNVHERSGGENPQEDQESWLFPLLILGGILL